MYSHSHLFCSGEDIVAWLVDRFQIDAQGERGNSVFLSLSVLNPQYQQFNSYFCLCLWFSAFRGQEFWLHAGGVRIHLPSAGPQALSHQTRCFALSLPGKHSTSQNLTNLKLGLIPSPYVCLDRADPSEIIQSG